MNVKQLINIVKTFKRANEDGERARVAQDEQATKLRRLTRSRDSAKQALLPAFAKVYGAKTSTTKSGAVRWVKGDKAAVAAKRALNRLLSLAYAGKSTKRAKVDPVVTLLRKFGKLSAAQQRRFLKSAR